MEFCAKIGVFYPLRNNNFTVPLDYYHLGKVPQLQSS